LTSDVSPYPNPVNDLLNVYNAKNSTSLMVISDLARKTVLRSQVNRVQNQLQLTNISSVVYLVELFKGGKKNIKSKIDDF